MKIILSPAKKMITDTDSIAPVGLPEFLDKTTEILSWLQGKSKEELKAIWKCNDKIAEQNFQKTRHNYSSGPGRGPLGVRGIRPQT